MTETELEQIKSQTLLNKTSVEPAKLVIMYGPPASGKSHLAETVLKTAIGIDSTSSSTIEINIDNIVGKLSGYKKELKEKNCTEVYSSAHVPSQIDKNKMETCKKIYGRFRFEEKMNGKSADDLSHEIFLDAVKKNMNIILETTGGSTDWTIKKNIQNEDVKAKGYKIIIVYPVVNTDTINLRAFERAKREGRYPTPEEIKDMVEKAQNNIGKLLEHVDRILIYDNNSEPILIADFEKKDGIVKGKCIEDKKLYEFLSFKTPDFVKFVDEKCHQAQTGGGKKYYIRYEN